MGTPEFQKCNSRKIALLGEDSPQGNDGGQVVSDLFLRFDLSENESTFLLIGEEPLDAASYLIEITSSKGQEFAKTTVTHFARGPLNRPARTSLPTQLGDWPSRQQ